MLAIGFDLDNTLYNRNENIRELTEKFMSERNISIPTNYFLKTFNRQSEIEYQKFIRGEKERDVYRVDRTIQTFSALNIDLPLEDIMMFKTQYDAAQKVLELRPHAIEFIQKMKENGHELFILTNGSSIDQRNKLETLQIEKYIPSDYWFISEELHMTKPNKKIFRFVKKQIDSEKVLYIGDNYTNDIAPTQEIGWKSIYIGESHKKEAIHSSFYKVQDFKEVCEYYIETNQFKE